MNISRFFIDRPVFAGVLSILIVVAGLIGMRSLPISEYPDVVPPQIVVRATYPGANPAVIAETVATPLEEQINGVEGMLYMSSQATSDGVLNLTVTFKLGTDPDKAQQLVQNRVSQAEPRLPSEVRSLGLTTVKSSPNFIMVVNLVSKTERYDITYLRNYATLNVKDRLNRIQGVGQVQVFGAGDYSMRIWLDPQKVAEHGLAASDVTSAIQSQNVQAAAGIIGASPTPAGVNLQLNVNAQGRLKTPEEFGDIIVKSGSNGEITRLRDVARIELGAADYTLRSLLDGEPAVAVAVLQAPGSNAIEIADNVRATMDELQKAMPEGVQYEIVYDTTKFVRASIEKVVDTLLEAVALVVLVVILFLQTWRASIIPLIAVPVSVIGTFAVMYAFGFSVNALTLFGLVLAIGIVVDDAIVVVENVERNIENGLSPRDATYRAMREVSGPIIAIALVLVAVFVPLAFISGLSGQFYRQFALTIAISTVISAINSLTLSPALAALLLQDHHAPRDRLTRVMDFFFGWFFRGFNRAFGAASRGYGRTVGGLLSRKSLVMVIYLALVGATYSMFNAVPGGFVPAQDKQYLIGFAQLPDGATLDRTESVIKQMSAIALKQPGVTHAIAFPGLSINGFTIGSNSGIVFAVLDDFENRKTPDLSGGAIAMALNKQYAGIEDAFIAMFPPPPVNGLGQTGGSKTVRASAIKDWTKPPRPSSAKPIRRLNCGNLLQLPDQRAAIVRRSGPREGTAAWCFRAGCLPDAADLSGFALRQRLQRLRPHLQRSRPGRLEVPREAGGYRSAEGSLAKRPDDSAVCSPEGGRVCRSRTHHALQRLPVVRYQRRTSTRLLLGQAQAAIEKILRETMPPGIDFEWTDLTYQQILAGNSSIVVFPLALLLVYLVLAAQYESLTLPLAIIMIVPMGVLAALTGVWWTGGDNNIFTQIGLVVLVGLSAKNAILIVEFARELEFEGRTPFQAAVEASRLRLRPILMTSMAFIMGVVPLVVSTGAGAEMRAAMGVAVFSGMIGVTFFGIFMTPVFYMLARLLTANRPLVNKNHNEPQPELRIAAE
ncbi:hypothetical protein Lal_00009356 [Lupinus albus]|nr:hypothetical protein Lal_00009356 [Lupinus albus]